MCPHQTLRRTLATLIVPAIAWLGAACERPSTPTDAPLPPAAFHFSNSPAPLWVNDNDPNGGLYAPPGTSCDDPGYPSVQAAVTAASPGDRINVCPGTYVEQVNIPAGKDNIRLRSTRRWEAVIKAPADDPLDLIKAIVRVNGAQNVTILAFTITGPGSGGCNSLRYGVRVDNGGSADILGNHITDIRDAPAPPLVSGCQNGVAVLVGRWLEGTTGSARIIGNVIDRYQKNGPTVDNAGSHAEISHNRILGVGPTSTIAQNGIQAGRGATADIRHNFVSQNIYTPGTDASTGILFYGSGPVNTDHNTLTSNDVDAYMFDYVFETGSCGTAAGSVTAHNRVRASTLDGLILSGFALAGCFVTGVQVADNKSEQNRGPGIGVYDARSNALDDNRAERNEDSGILLDDAQSNTVGDSKVRNNGTANADMTDGIRVTASSTGNTIHDNHLQHNVTHDCHDFSVGTGTAGTANTWINNRGETSIPAALCGEADDADFETSTVYGWDPNYPWYDAFDVVAAEYDWAAAYATIDIESLLQVLPQIRVGSIRRVIVSPTP